MPTAPDALPQGRTPLGRADLLLLLAQTGNAADGLAAALGFELRPSQSSRHKQADSTPPPLYQQEQPQAVRTQDHRMVMYGAAPLAGGGEEADERDADTQGAPAPASTPLTAADWLPAPDAPKPEAPSAIVPRQRLLPVLVRATSGMATGAVDIDRLAANLARRRLPSRLPLRQRQRPAARLSLVLDLGGELAFYRADMHRLARWLERHPDIRPHRVCVPADPQNPEAGWIDWRAANAPRQAQQQSAARTEPWWRPVHGEQIVLVSDLGMAGPLGASTNPSSAWSGWLQAMQKAGACVLVCSPVPLRGDAPQGPAQDVPVMHWSAAGPLRVTRLGQLAQHRSPARMALAQALLARLACAPWIDAALLRQLRLAMPGADDAGLEHLAWSLGVLTPGLVARRLLSTEQSPYRSVFAQLPQAVQLQTLAMVQAHYERLSPPLAHMHALAWQSRAAPAACARAAPLLRQAQVFVQSLTQHAGQPQGVSELELALCLGGWLQAADQPERQHHAHLYASVWQAWQQLHDLPLPLPEGVSHALVAPPDAPPAQALWLVVNAASGQAMLTPQPSPGQGLLNAQPLHLATLDVGPIGGHAQHLVTLQPGAAQPLGVPGAGLLLRSGGGQWQVSAIARPHGVVAWAQDHRGLRLRAPSLGALALEAGPADIQLHPPSDQGQGLLQLVVASQASGHPGLSWGIDAEHGLWLDVTIGTAVQRFRWAPPGEFWMGSPADEPGRYDREGPQHRVQISQGFWVGDSPCTQAFWEAVTGNKPSHFEGSEDLPVEQVSWEDAQAMLQQLAAHLPAGVSPALPTEAQWEYAARAGTATAFNLGDTLGQEQANLGHRTTPVKQFKPNAWGLHDCHGQVFEWCDDGMRDYAATAQDGGVLVDPRLPAGPAVLRVVRGGSWSLVPRDARSACRDAARPGYRYLSLGLRLVLCLPLRSTSPAQFKGPEGPQGPGTGPAPGGTPGAAR